MRRPLRTDRPPFYPPCPADVISEVASFLCVEVAKADCRLSVMEGGSLVWDPLLAGVMHHFTKRPESDPRSLRSWGSKGLNLIDPLLKGFDLMSACEPRSIRQSIWGNTFSDTFSDDTFGDACPYTVERLAHTHT